MTLNLARLTLCLRFLVDTLYFFDEAFIKLDSLRLKILSLLLSQRSSIFEFLSDGVDFSFEDFIIVGDEGESLRNFNIIFVDILDFDMNCIHFVDSLNDFLLLKFVLFI